MLINIGEVYLRYRKKNIEGKGECKVDMSRLTIMEYRRKALEIFMDCKKIFED